MLTESNAKLLAKVVDLESRSRRNNIRIIGLPESIEGPRPSVFFSELLSEVFGNGVLESPPECDRGHCRTNRGQDRDLGLLLSGFTSFNRKKRSSARLERRGESFTIMALLLLSTRTRLQRYWNNISKYKEVLSELYKLGLKPALLFPARLTIITKQVNRRRLTSVAESNDYIASLRSAED